LERTKDVKNCALPSCPFLFSHYNIGKVSSCPFVQEDKFINMNAPPSPLILSTIEIPLSPGAGEVVDASDVMISSTDEGARFEEIMKERNRVSFFLILFLCLFFYHH
jgi:hypothetical protein